MAAKAILDYIKMARANGRNDEYITASLLAGGWQLADIQEALKTNDVPQEAEVEKIAVSNSRLDWIVPIIVIFFMAVVVVIAAGKILHRVPTDIRVTGDDIRISCGKIKIIAQATPESIYAFVINSGSASEFNDGLFAAWTMDQANSLKSQYGDFTHCGSAGSQAGMNSLGNVIVYAADDSAREKLKNLINISNNEPVVEFRGCQLRIKEQLYNNSKFEFSGMPGEVRYYLVKDVKILKDNYNK